MNLLHRHGVRGSVGLFNLHRNGEMIVTSGLNHLPLHVVALASCKRDPGTDLGGGLIEPIVAPK